MRYETFYNERDYENFYNNTKCWEKKFRDAFHREQMTPPQKYPAVLVWELVSVSGSTYGGFFSYIYIYRDGQLIKDLFSDLSGSDNSAIEDKKKCKKKKL